MDHTWIQSPLFYKKGEFYHAHKLLGLKRGPELDAVLEDVAPDGYAFFTNETGGAEKIKANGDNNFYFGSVGLTNDRQGIIVEAFTIEASW